MFSGGGNVLCSQYLLYIMIFYSFLLLHDKSASIRYLFSVSVKCHCSRIVCSRVHVFSPSWWWRGQIYFYSGAAEPHLVCLDQVVGVHSQREGRGMLHVLGAHRFHLHRHVGLHPELTLAVVAHLEAQFVPIKENVSLPHLGFGSSGSDSFFPLFVGLGSNSE